MTMRLVYNYNAGDFAANLTALQARLARAATAAVTEVTALAKTAGRATIANAGLSKKWQGGLFSRVYPKGRDSLNPAGFISHKIPYASVFQDGATIVAKKNLLWLPLPSVPIASGGRRLTPKQYVDRIGPLVPVILPGKPPMLLGRGSTLGITRASEKSVRLRKRAVRSGTVLGPMVPLYIGKPAVKDPQLFDVKGAIALVVASRLNDLYQKQLEAD